MKRILDQWTIGWWGQKIISQILEVKSQKARRRRSKRRTLDIGVIVFAGNKEVWGIAMAVRS